MKNGHPRREKSRTTERGGDKGCIPLFSCWQQLKSLHPQPDKGFCIPCLKHRADKTWRESYL